MSSESTPHTTSNHPLNNSEGQPLPHTPPSENQPRSTTPGGDGYLSFAVHDGLLDAWLAAGPAPISALDDSDSFRQGQPAEGADVWDKDGSPAPNVLGLWQVIHAAEDHLLHLDARAEAGAGHAAWLFGVLHASTAAQVTLTLTHSQPLTIWLGGQKHDFPVPAQIDAVGLGETTVNWAVEAGDNDVWIYAPAVQNGRWIAGAQVGNAQDTAPRELEWRLPTTLAPLDRRAKLAAIGAEAFLEQSVFQAKERVWVKWPPTSQLYDNLTVRLQAPNRRIYAEGYIEATAGTSIPVSWPEQLPDGRYDVVLMPKLDEYFEKRMRIVQRIPLYTVRNSHSAVYYGDYAGRAREALVDAARRKGLYAQIARLALGQMDKVDAGVLEAALARVREGGNGWPWLALGLVGMHLRFGGESAYPHSVGAGLRAWLGDPQTNERLGALASEADEPVAAESLALVGATLAHLGARLAANEKVAAETGEALVDWLGDRARTGFAGWDSPIAFAQMTAALSHLVDLSTDEEVVELAAVVLDKLLLALALNSHLGVFGGAHASTAATIQMGQGMDPTGGIARLAWGKGTFNAWLPGVVSLACAGVYEVPEIIAATAVDESTPMQCQAWHAPAAGPSDGASDVHKLTWRTATGMLGAALDYRPGEVGRTEQVWQATLGPGAAIFVNQPACAQDAPVLLDEDVLNMPVGPGFWCGNGVMPRVAQLENLLVAWYCVPADARLPFTHAWFPCAAFDEYSVAEQWAFARKGSGYVALYASQGVQLMRQGPWARRELRAGEGSCFWLCRLGDATTDGTFQEFQAQAQASEIRVDGHASAQVTNAWGRDLRFGWEGPLLAGTTGAELAQWPLRFDQHYAGTYVAAPMPAPYLEVDYQGHGLRLAFGGPDGT